MIIAARSLSRCVSRLALAPLLLLLQWPASPARAATINITDVTVNGIPVSNYLGNDNQNHVGGFLHDVLFQRAVPGSGTGSYRKVFRLEDNADADLIERGYNRNGIMDSTTASGYVPGIRISDLSKNSEGGFYMFALEANESGAAPNNYLSLDMFQIYVGGVTDPAPLPPSEANLPQLGTRIYTFSTGDNVLIDASLGANGADMYVYVPVNLFAGFSSSSLVYLFASHGGYTGAPGFSASPGFEEWATIKDPQPSFVPEPSSLLLASAAGLLLASRRRRH